MVHAYGAIVTGTYCTVRTKYAGYSCGLLPVLSSALCTQCRYWPLASHWSRALVYSVVYTIHYVLL